MKNTNPIFSLKNFRSFGEEGADFELAPITVLTGCNSAGKSSLVKAQLLLEQALKDEKTNLHVSDKELKLGNFSKIINNRAKNGTVTFSYVIHSNLLCEDVRVILEFIDNNDEVGDGKLLSRSVEKLDGTKIVHKDGTFNYLAILNNYRRYAVFNIFDGSIVDVKKAEIGEDDAATVNNYIDRYKKSLKYCKRYGIDDDMLFAYRSTKHLDKAQVSYREPWQADLERMFEEVSSWIETNTFFYCLPIFKAVEGKDKKYVREYLLESIASGNRELKEGKYDQQLVNPYMNRASSWETVAESAVNWAHHIADDFESSQFDSFLEYFISLEQDAMSGNDSYEGVLFSLHPNSKPVNSVWKTEERWNQECKDYYEKVKKYEKEWPFMAVVQALCSICFHYDDTSFSEEIPQNPIASSLKLRRCLESFFYGMTSEVYSPLFLNSITYVNSSSVDIKRLYSSDDNDKIGICIKQYLEGNKQTFDTPWGVEREGDYKPGEFMNKWIKDSGLGKRIGIRGTDEGLGMLVYLEKEKEHEKVLLADEGYGVTQLIALLLQIENKILNATRWSFAIARGYLGESPIQYIPSVIYIEEPENHLHPKYQSLLADMFVEAYQKYNIHFIIETHSEYLIRKLQVLVADKENKLTPNDVSLNYVDKAENGISTNRKIEIREDGCLSAPFGTGFFDESKNLVMKMMKF